MVDEPRGGWNLLHFVGLGALLFATFANYALQELGHDEGMYLGASYLNIDHDLYSEVGYFQAPNLPLLLSSLFAWTDVTHFLMWGRIATYVHHAATLILLGAISWHFTRNATLSFLFVTALGWNGFLYGAGYSIDNTTFASTYLLAGFYLCVRAHDRTWKPMLLVAASGFLVAIAAGFKLNYVPYLVCFILVVALFSPRRALVPYLLGSVVGLTPSLYLAITRSAAFWFNNVVWHRRLLAMNVAELGTRETAAGFVTDAWFYLTRPVWLAIPALLVGAFLVLFDLERKSFWSFERTLTSLLITASLATIVGLGAVRFWYLQPAVIVAALLVPIVISQLRPGRLIVARAVLTFAAVAGVLLQAPSLVSAVRVFDTGAWVPLRYSAVGKDVAGLQQTRRPQRVDVIGNPAIVYGVEGALALTPSAATGAFVRVSSPMLTRHFVIDETVATYERLSNGDAEMVIATVDYVLPRASVAPSDWCAPDRPESSFDGLFDRLCNSGHRRVVLGDGPARVVVFYR